MKLTLQFYNLFELNMTQILINIRQTFFLNYFFSNINSYDDSYDKDK